MAQKAFRSSDTSQFSESTEASTVSTFLSFLTVKGKPLTSITRVCSVTISLDTPTFHSAFLRRPREAETAASRGYKLTGTLTTDQLVIPSNAQDKSVCLPAL